ncbi:unnamed protein product [Phytophthora fragariaefolia]|uniref:Unnamed protein product n=1 Tax=Phytophthora fragariaefolia TaxID=1490495 RepID=A0A9W6YJH7_9STRA|nr:unnamed protein product [Phytophthora fragariaefolia]
MRDVANCISVDEGRDPPFVQLPRVRGGVPGAQPPWGYLLAVVAVVQWQRAGQPDRNRREDDTFDEVDSVYRDLIAKDLPFPDIPPIDTNQVVTLPFSSGTTGRPKGVELTARAMYASGVIPGYRESKSGSVLGMMPFFHIMMTMNFHVTLYLGKTMIVLPGFTPETFLRTVEKHKLDMINLAPPLVTFLAKHPIVDEYNLSHVKHVKSGGAPLGKEVERAVMQRLGIRVLQGYGMTEFVGCGCRTYPKIFRDGSSGTLHPNTELKVKDLETDEDLPANKTGELLFRTPAIMKGYYKNPNATQAAFTEDGFLRTGDLGYIDDDGFIFIVDRLKELIKYKGHQVAPAEVEDVVNSHPLVADSCCVRGRNVETGEEIPKAFVVLKQGEVLTGEELMSYVAAKVARYKQVREVEFIDIIPKSLSASLFHATTFKGLGLVQLPTFLDSLLPHLPGEAHDCGLPEHPRFMTCSWV